MTTSLSFEPTDAVAQVAGAGADVGVNANADGSIGTGGISGTSSGTEGDDSDHDDDVDRDTSKDDGSCFHGRNPPGPSSRWPKCG